MTQPAAISRSQEPVASPPARAHRIAISVLLGVSWVLWSTVAWEVFFLVPAIHRVFNDFRMRIPWLTELVLLHAWWFVPAYAFLTLLVCIGLVYFRQRSLLGWVFLLIVLPSIIGVLLFAVLWIPYAQLIEGVTRRPPSVWDFLWR